MNQQLVEKIKVIFTKSKNVEDFNAFYFLYDALLDVVEDFQTEALDSLKQKSEELVFNPFIDEKKPNEPVKILMNLLNIIVRLQIQNSTIIVAFIFVDRLIKVCKSFLNWSSLEK